MSIRAYAVVERLLAHAPVPLPSSVFEQPMTAAVSLEDGDMINMMMAVLSRYRRMGFKRSKVLRSDSTYGLLEPIQKAIDKECPEILELVLGHLRDYMKLPDKTHFRKWINQAVKLKHNKALISLLQAAPASSPIRINSKVFELGCRTGDSAIVNTLLTFGRIQLDSDNTSVSTLAIAIRLGHIPVIRTVIEAGADINMAMGTHRLKSKARTTVTPIEYAIHLKKYDAVAYLIECGASVPPVDTWPPSRKMQKVLQNAVNKKGATAK
ncbi:uncharacterized protein ALTATR162_LOCUS9620 [Alternaria atra]|uniref:Ankyrin repeat protein n=1 Tax=Alternaria atra TaxID=119953 RepID=A0A8J2I8R9_9PLEO|nr:uncharacterized protein ALTATR162_LOCUS9620 [Alternaria atra]CAG5181154.1 unnamed protein product [Alternaria atra]